MKSAIIGLIGMTVGIAVHQMWMHRELREIEALALEICELLEKDKVEEQFQEIVERFDED